MRREQFELKSFQRSEVFLFLERLKGDWDRQPPEYRKQWTVKDAVLLHSVTGAFLHFRNGLKSHIPKADYDAALPNLDSQFLSGYIDAELSHLVSTSVPTMQLRDVAFLRRILTLID